MRNRSLVQARRLCADLKTCTATLAVSVVMIMVAPTMEHCHVRVPQRQPQLSVGHGSGGVQPSALPLDIKKKQIEQTQSARSAAARWALVQLCTSSEPWPSLHWGSISETLILEIERAQLKQSSNRPWGRWGSAANIRNPPGLARPCA